MPRSSRSQVILSLENILNKFCLSKPKRTAFKSPGSGSTEWDKIVSVTQSLSENDQAPYKSSFYVTIYNL